VCERECVRACVPVKGVRLRMYECTLLLVCMCLVCVFLCRLYIFCGYFISTAELNLSAQVFSE
jgi:hypothetical protein